MVFYKQVLSKTGFDKYKVIDVQYKGQVVASKYAGNAKVDSVQLRKNVEKLLRQSIEAENDTIIRAVAPIIKLEADSAIASDPSLQDDKVITPEKKSSPNPLKSLSPAKPSVKTPLQPVVNNKKNTPPPAKENKPRQEEKKKEPKAVMPKKTTEEENGGYN